MIITSKTSSYSCNFEILLFKQTSSWDLKLTTILVALNKIGCNVKVAFTQIIID